MLSLYIDIYGVFDHVDTNSLVYLDGWLRGFSVVEVYWRVVVTFPRFCVFLSVSG
jgi:hypothetical protein